ncbi:BTB/POZ domain-containing protein 7-like [Anneissia japonica]|uniref:BTB/POZ domain-containing protein 7-like n=1 Tax=Anneissia japonica TaxID=1529436 RepID=UPI00142592BE|nr:BTB/POZ domain-containing protein 7-like [Anneissia japonica]XP_033104971.1 BTB/POZ domain-containing protein 7-like [Anneissia japonica]
MGNNMTALPGEGREKSKHRSVNFDMGVNVDREQSATLFPRDCSVRGDEVLEPRHATMPVKVEKEKKKKTPSLSTIKKKLVGKKRHSKSLDYARAIKDVLSSWNIRDVKALVDEYESLAILKQMSIQTTLARPKTLPLSQNLARLYDCQHCADVDLVFLGTVFPVHRAILSVRCRYFRDVFSKYPEYCSSIPIKQLPGVSVTMFSVLLKYLYTGEIDTHNPRLENLDVLIQLGDKFGTPNILEQDLKYLLDTGEFADAVVVFASDSHSKQSERNMPICPSRSTRNTFLCHKAILSARSPFFRNLLQRKQRESEERRENELPKKTKIVLDANVIPKKYAHVLLNAIYLDTLDLSLIKDDYLESSSLGEAQAMVLGRKPISRIDQAMECYQIAQFLDMTSMAQACEDVIAESINTENIIAILSWSSLPHGSSWVHRQAMHYLKEEFLAVMASPTLCDITKGDLLTALKSDFLQASELEVLKAVVKWGEQQLVKKMEEREPNVVSNTQHSLSRKGIKRRDLDNMELREILSDIIPYVRVQHIIPRNHDILNSAIKRGLIPMLPSHMVDGEEASSVNYWVKGKSRRRYPRPRLFSPYMEEAKAMLEEQMAAEMELVRLRMIRMSHVPDTLYMLDDTKYSASQRGQCSSYPPAIAASNLPVPDDSTIAAMLQREKELRRCNLTQRAYALVHTDSAAVSREIHTRVVREFGLPDEAVEIFHSVPEHYGEDQSGEAEDDMFGRVWDVQHDMQDGTVSATPDPPEVAAAAQVVPMLSDIMPDIAIPSSPDITIATAPSVNQMLLQEPELGDGHFSRRKKLSNKPAHSRRDTNACTDV